MVSGTAGLLNAVDVEVVNLYLYRGRVWWGDLFLQWQFSEICVLSLLVAII